MSARIAFGPKVNTDTTTASRRVDNVNTVVVMIVNLVLRNTEKQENKFSEKLNV
jgi:hypothetical protein